MRRVVSDKRICGGRPTFEGTRLEVALIGELLQHMPIEDVRADYKSLDEDDFETARKYVAQPSSVKVEEPSEAVQRPRRARTHVRN